MQGELQLVGVDVTGSLGENEVLQLAAAAEASTRHPLADSVARAAGQRGLRIPSHQEASTEPGSGVCAFVDGKQVPRRTQLLQFYAIFFIRDSVILVSWLEYWILLSYNMVLLRKIKAVFPVSQQWLGAAGGSR